VNFFIPTRSILAIFLAVCIKPDESQFGVSARTISYVHFLSMMSAKTVSLVSAWKNIHGVCLDNVLCVCLKKCPWCLLGICSLCLLGKMSMVSAWIMSFLSVRKNVHGVCLDNVLCVCSDKCLQYGGCLEYVLCVCSVSMVSVWIMSSLLLFVSASKLFLESVWIIGHWKDFHN
jgi:hypothetical protein